ncbi:MAG: hypothetical protein AAGA55_02675 [Planctomycetota bacterium]
MRTFFNAFALTELLAAVTLLAVMFACAAPLVVSSHEYAATQDLRARVISIDSHARSAGVRRGPVRLAVAPDGRGLAIEIVESDSVLSRLASADATCFMVNADGRPVGAQVIDRLGRSQSYSLILRHESGRTQRIDFGPYGLIDGGAP